MKNEYYIYNRHQANYLINNRCARFIKKVGFNRKFQFYVLFERNEETESVTNEWKSRKA